MIEDDFHPNIVKAWQIDNDAELIFNFNDKKNLKECIEMGLGAEDIAYLVNRCRENNTLTHFFSYDGLNLHIFSKAEIGGDIDRQIEQIAYNVLKYPYKDVYADLYKEFVVPMIEQQLKN